MSGYRYDAQTDNFVEKTASSPLLSEPDGVRYSAADNNYIDIQTAESSVSAPASRTNGHPAPAYVVTRAVKREARERMLQEFRITEMMNRVANGSVQVVQGNYFSTQDIQDLTAQNMRPATDADTNFDRMIIPDAAGRLRELRVCATEITAAAPAVAQDTQPDPAQNQPAATKFRYPAGIVQPTVQA